MHAAPERMRIAIATAGRFHVLDLARELAALGHEVRFYSYVPRARAIAFGLQKECHVDLFPLLGPIALLERYAPRSEMVQRIVWSALDSAVMATMKPCDVFVFMSGIYLAAPLYARKRYGAKLVLVRGSKHILVQDEILAAVDGAERPTPLSISREMLGYQISDMIAVPSEHARLSFARQPAIFPKVVRNPYGVDLGTFPISNCLERQAGPTFVFAGPWSKRKGCDLLASAIRADPARRLIHVGKMGDLPFPEGDPQFKHTPHVDQMKLRGIYRQAHAFAIASREDGFGNVITQALATGLPVLCTTDTGGTDLQHTPALKDRLIVVPSNDVEALSDGMHLIWRRMISGPPFAELTDADREALSWSAFARRYEQNLLRLTRVA